MTREIVGGVRRGYSIRLKRVYQVSGMWKASAGGVNKEQARENFHQECEDEQRFSAHNQG